MDHSSHISLGAYASAFTNALSRDAVRDRAPAVFAGSAHERTSSSYTFIPTERVLAALMQAGFVPVDARQARARATSVLHARHIVRLRRRFETIRLRDALPEIVFLNSHDGTSAYQLRIGIFRVVCTNGLIVSRGAFPSFRVSHRGNVVDQVVTGALEISERFGKLGDASGANGAARAVQGRTDPIRRARVSSAVPWPKRKRISTLETLDLQADRGLGSDLWSTLNKVQENLLRGGLTRMVATGRLTRTRRITSIREDIRLNSGLWDFAAEVLAV